MIVILILVALEVTEVVMELVALRLSHLELEVVLLLGLVVLG
jgi:hypothetical protein